MPRKFQLRYFVLFALVLLVQGQSRAISTRDTVDTAPILMQYDGVDYKGAPWVRRTSRRYSFERGLEGRHLSVWASHGRYFDSSKDKWQWQRPFLFCTTEDMLTQSFVYPYLIPMLERAGAVVFTPRERDYQTHESIVDNDTPGRYGSYIEQGRWSDAGTGFGLNYAVLNDTVQPFRIGTFRSAVAGSGAVAMWMPQIPATGRYAVYVSYATLPNSVSDAQYVVHHAGGTSTFAVNQRMGGGTWVYLGTFLFDEGQSERNRVVLTAESSMAASNPGQWVVTADAVRFGGGRGLVERSVPDVTTSYTQRTVEVLRDSVLCDSLVTDTLYHYHYGKGVRSGMPRYLEAARYYTQWAGLEDSLYCRDHGLDDYKDDLRSRSYLLNRLSGGSCYQPDTIGRNVPLEMQFALHTDAGFHRNGGVYGSLTIATGYGDNGSETYRTGLSREVSRDLAGRMLDGVAHDLSQLYGVQWPERELRVSNYSETRSPQVPAVIFELLAHQSFTDMKFAHDPNFKYAASRAIYKVLLRDIYHLHNLGDPVVQPLPVQAMSARLSADGSVAMLSWSPQGDPLEPTAVPSNYVLYTRNGSNDWDEGTLLGGPEPRVNVKVTPGVHWQYRVAAVNGGGESFPSEPVSVYVPAQGNASPHNSVLVVNAFDRLSGPAWVETKDSLGFDIRRDVGVSYGVNTSIAGAQKIFARSAMGKSDTSALGYCGTEYTGVALAGNNFDGIALHTADIMAVAPGMCVVSMSRAAFDNLSPDELRQYGVVDYVAGLQADKAYNLKHYEVFGERTRALLANYAEQGGRLLVSGASVGEADSLFLARTFHAVKRATISHTARGTFSGLGIDLPVYNLPNDVHYPCQTSDVIEPADDTAFAAFAYAQNNVRQGNEGYSAGVAWPHGVLMGFPYDCIAESDTRQKVMKAVLQYLAK